MASALALMSVPSAFNQFGVGPSYGATEGYSETPPDYQETVDAVKRQQEEGQKAVNQLATAFKTHNEGLVTRIANTEKTAVAQLNKQKEVFKATTVDVKDIEMPGIDPNVLLYGGVAFGILALFIVTQR
jgi:hypothetical protein